MKRFGAVSSIEESPHLTVSAPSWSAMFDRHLAYTVLLILGVGVHAVAFICWPLLPSVVADLGGGIHLGHHALYHRRHHGYGVRGADVGQAESASRLHSGGAGELVSWAGALWHPHRGAALARTIQGFGSGLMVALAYSMVSEFYAATMRARVLSAISGIWGVAALLGPIVGGVFATSGWWRGAFWVAIPILILLGSLARQVLPDHAVEGVVGEFPAARLALLGLGVLGVAAVGSSPVVWRLTARWAAPRDCLVCLSSHVTPPIACFLRSRCR
jgi:MFS family permease